MKYLILSGVCLLWAVANVVMFTIGAICVGFYMFGHAPTGFGLNGVICMVLGQLGADQGFKGAHWALDRG